MSNNIARSYNEVAQFNFYWFGVKEMLRNMCDGGKDRERERERDDDKCGKDVRSEMNNTKNI